MSVMPICEKYSQACGQVSQRAALRPVWGVIFTLVLGVSQGALAETTDDAIPNLVAPREQKLVIGRVSDDPKKHFSRMIRFGTYLAERLDRNGIVTADVLVALTPEALIRSLRDGRVDLVSETPFLAVRLIDEAGAEPLVREWKKGVPSYHSVLIQRMGNDVSELSDLKGRKIAFEDAGSTSAYLLPAAILKQQGLELTQLTSIFDKAPQNKVGFLFAGSEKGVVSAVARGLVDVGALSNLDWDELVRTPENLREQLKIFYESAPVLRSLILVRKGMDGNLKQRIKQLLLAMNENAAGQAAMKMFNRATRHDELDQDARDSLSRVRALIPLISQLQR